LDRLGVLRRSSLDVWDDRLGDIWQRSQFATPSSYLTEGWTQLLAALDKVPMTVQGDGLDICQSIGGGWVAEEALACALACVLKEPADLNAILHWGANNSGDSDSISSIAGAIAGAYLGTQAIPKEWKKRVESRQLLHELSAQLCALQQKIQAE
jgi:hypothetical protein